MKFNTQPYPCYLAENLFNLIKLECIDINFVFKDIIKYVKNIDNTVELEYNEEDGEIVIKNSYFKANIVAYQNKNDLYLDFNRLSGCAFLYRKFILDIKYFLNQKNYIVCDNLALIKNIEDAKNKIDHWYQLPINIPN